MRSLGSTLTLIVMDDEGVKEPRTYRVEPRKALAWLAAVAFSVGAIMVLLVVATPIRGLFPGLASEQMREEAQMNAMRLQSVEDSLAAQDAYLAHLRALVLGDVEPGAVPETAGQSVAAGAEEEEGVPAAILPGRRSSEDPQTRRVMEAADAMPMPSSSNGSVSSIRFPVLAPVTGVFTRGYVVREGHYAVDFAASEGSIVRSVGDGYVIFADWTHDAGHVIMVQHADGFVSVYKHNQRLTRRPGDRVASRETIALSGNTGEFTTGPHLHFELWRNGMALDPRDYIVGL